MSYFEHTYIMQNCLSLGGATHLVTHTVILVYNQPVTVLSHTQDNLSLQRSMTHNSVGPKHTKGNLEQA